MANAIDMFRAQKAAVDQVHARLTEVAGLVQRLRAQIDAITQDEKLREVINCERDWLARTREALVEVRRFREQEANEFWPAVWRRWITAIALALASIFAAGAGQAWLTQPHVEELRSLRSRVDVADRIAERMLFMTSAERQQLDRLMKWNLSR